jgi:putative transposase
MTAPRPIVPGTTYLISRRCTQRQFLLRPTKQTRQIYEYCLAEAAARFDVLLIGWLAMTNHHHSKVHDRAGNLPAFLAHLHKMIAKALNAHWGRWENLFAAEQVCVTKCVGTSDALDKLVYVLTNPITAGLVDKVRDWPGASSLDFLDGGERTVFRPKGFFREGGRMPEAVTLRAQPPPEWTHRAADWASLVRAKVARTEEAAREARARTGQRILGRKAVRRLSAFDRPSTVAPRRRLRPFIACRDRARRVAALHELREFRAAYRAARDAFVAGAADVLFPAGTYLFRLLGARCATALGPPATAPPRLLQNSLSS